jgi:hypothetical protein
VESNWTSRRRITSRAIDFWLYRADYFRVSPSPTRFDRHLELDRRQLDAGV